MELRPLDLADPATADEVLSLQRSAYRIEAELIGSDGIPPLGETLAELQACGETFLGAFVEERLAGAISWKLEGETLDLHRLVVDPGRFRGGIGTALVRAALGAEPDAEWAFVQTGAGNEPARRLYLREGFRERDEIEVAPGLRATRFEKRLT